MQRFGLDLFELDVADEEDDEEDDEFWSALAAALRCWRRSIIRFLSSFRLYLSCVEYRGTFWRSRVGMQESVVPSAVWHWCLQKVFGSVPTTPIRIKNLLRTCELSWGVLFFEIVGRKICAVMVNDMISWVLWGGHGRRGMFCWGMLDANYCTSQRNPKPEGNCSWAHSDGIFHWETVGKIMDRRQNRMDSYVRLGLTPNFCWSLPDVRRRVFFTEGGCQELSRRHSKQNTVEEVCGCTKCEERSARRLEIYVL